MGKDRRNRDFNISLIHEPLEVLLHCELYEFVQMD